MVGGGDQVCSLHCSSRQGAKTEEIIHVLYAKKASMDFAQPLPLLSLPEPFNIKYLKSGNALKQIMTKPLPLAKQRTGLTALKSKTKEWAASYWFSVSFLILVVFWPRVKRQEPVFAEWSQDWATRCSILLSLGPQQMAGEPVLCPSSSQGQQSPGAGPDSLLLGCMESNYRQRGVLLCNGKIHVYEPEWRFLKLFSM